MALRAGDLSAAGELLNVQAFETRREEQGFSGTESMDSPLDSWKGFLWQGLESKHTSLPRKMESYPQITT